MASSFFQTHLHTLPRLGVGISGEYGSASKGIDACAMKELYPELLHFFEYGCDIDRGLDEHVRHWAGSGLPTTYHFLDINLEEKIDSDRHWLTRTQMLASEINAAWLCGDAGRWHFGPRERGHQMLMPPILCEESATQTAESIQWIQSETGRLVLPENPPAVVYLGDMHILDYFGKVADQADCGILLDCAHLSIFQHSRGHSPLTGFDGFPFERVIEIHVAGGTPVESNGFGYIDDTHSPEPIPETWEILEHVVKHATNLRAIVYECEHNVLEACLDNFARLNALFPASTQISAEVAPL
ncbi:MAG TPA: DUF692 family protein [Acidobacteriota bacterium]|nr:DUF692 family protein [Acidobacteriota bacterium]HNJ41452.1 DUF692 family protein [Acidobacteriota bacterium]